MQKPPASETRGRPNHFLFFFVLRQIQETREVEPIAPSPPHHWHAHDAVVQAADDSMSATSPTSARDAAKRLSQSVHRAHRARRVARDDPRGNAAIAIRRKIGSADNQQQPRLCPGCRQAHREPLGQGSQLVRKLLRTIPPRSSTRNETGSREHDGLLECS
jgi:hypothetical protein